MVPINKSGLSFSVKAIEKMELGGYEELMGMSPQDLLAHLDKVRYGLAAARNVVKALEPYQELVSNALDQAKKQADSASGVPYQWAYDDGFRRGQANEASEHPLAFYSESSKIQGLATRLGYQNGTPERASFIKGYVAGEQSTLANKNLPSARSRFDLLLPDISRDLDAAIDLIEANGYSGFSLDQLHWYCVRHAIETFFDGDFKSVKDYAIGLVGNLVTPQGQVVYGWKGQSDLFGVYCSISNCPEKISQEEEG